MRHTLLLLTSVIVHIAAQAQQGWVTRIGGPAVCEANAIAVGRDGAVYAGGSWQGPGTSGTDMYVF